MGEQSNLSIGHSSGDEPGKTKTVNAESSNAWYVNMNNGNVNTNNKTNAGRVRPVSATDKPIYDIPLSWKNVFRHREMFQKIAVLAKEHFRLLPI